MKKVFKEAIKFLKRNKAFTKSISFVLSLVLVFYVIPSTIYAQVAKSFNKANAETTDTAIAMPNYEYTDSESVLDAVLFEAIELREENVKHFRLSDGRYIAAQYDYPVHELDENGKWQDIDNALSENGSEFSNSNAKIKFAKKITGNSDLFTLHDGNTKITMSLIGAEKGTVGVVNNNADAESDTELQKMMNLEKLSSKILYKDIFDGIDIEYVIHSVNVKENIIVKEKKDAYSYSFELKLNGLTPVLTESGDIELYDSGTNTVKYVIPSPVVYDSIGIHAPNNSSSYTLTHKNGNKYTLTVTVDSSWMNSDERVFPVTVDPTVKDHNSLVDDTYIDSSSPTSSFSSSQYLCVANGKQSYWRSSDLPKVSVGAKILEAEIGFMTTEQVTAGSYVGIYEVVGYWNTSLTWNKYSSTTAGALSEYPNDYCKIDNAGTYYFDVTEIVSKWYLGDDGGYIDQYGLALAAIPGYNANVQFNSNDSNVKPTLFITYVDMKGVEGYWPYSSHSNQAGAGSINLANGNLVLAIPTLSSTDNLFGFTPTLIYNSVLFYEKYAKTITLRTAFSNPYTGYGLKLNVSESIVEKENKLDDENVFNYYIYADSDGTEHEMYKSEAANAYVDAEGLGLVLTVYENSLELKDDTKTVRRFCKMDSSFNYVYKSCWYLAEIEDSNGNKLIFDVDSRYRPLSVKIRPYGASENIEMLKFIYNSELTLCAVYNPTSKQSGYTKIFYITRLNDIERRV